MSLLKKGLKAFRRAVPAALKVAAVAPLPGMGGLNPALKVATALLPQPKGVIRPLGDRTGPARPAPRTVPALQPKPVIQPTGQVRNMSMLPSLASLPGVGRAVVRQLPGVGAGVGTAVLMGRDGQPKKKRRRMNPMNVKAARRAIRRVKAARKMLQEIERQLPKAKSRAPARQARARSGRNLEIVNVD